MGSSIKIPRSAYSPIGAIIILLLLTKPYTFAQVPALAYQDPRSIIEQPVLAIIHYVGYINVKHIGF
jgi:hypothetical protein